MINQYPCDISHKCMQNIDLSKIVKAVKAIIFVISVHNHKLVNPLISQLIRFQCKPREWRLNQGFSPAFSPA